MFSELLHQKFRRSLVIEINPFQILVAGFSRSGSGQVTLHSVGEFAKHDDAGLQQWLDTHFHGQRSWVPSICGLVPSQSLMQRETLQLQKLTEADYLPNLMRERFKVANPEEWRFRVLNPVDGTPPPAGDRAMLPALICGVPQRDVAEVEQWLFARRLRPERLEPSLHAVFGAMFSHMTWQDDKRAAVVVSIEDEQTVPYVLGKEGVHTPTPLRLGLNAMLQAARRELGLAEGDDVLAELRRPRTDQRLIGPKIVRAIARDLKPLIDSYEMTTGQPAGGIYCAYLPEDLAWLGTALAEAVERPLIAVDCAAWFQPLRITADASVPALRPHWLGTLGLIANFPAPTSLNLSRQDPSYHGPWHLDYQLAADVPVRQLVGREFLTGALAIGLAGLALTVAAWQVSIIRTLRADTAYWETEMAKNRKLFDELTRTATDLQEKSARLESAYTLMASPYQVTDFVMNLGRTLPRNTRIDRIELSQGKIALSGALREPSESASGTLNRYLELLRGSPAVGPLFSSIGLTALQRETDSDAMAFEITFKLKAPAPAATP